MTNIWKDKKSSLENITWSVMDNKSSKCRKKGNKLSALVSFKWLEIRFSRINLY